MGDQIEDNVNNVDETENNSYPEHGIPLIDITDPKYADCIINNARVDFGNNRIVQEHIKIVQYDKNARIIAVGLYCNGFEYILPDYIVENGRAQIRWGNPDHTFIDDLVLGCDKNEKNVIYFEVDERMTYYAGPHAPILVLIYSKKDPDTGEDIVYQVGSSPIPIDIEKNPIQNGDIESMPEYPYIETEMELLKQRMDELESNTIHYGDDEPERIEGMIWLYPVNNNE